MATKVWANDDDIAADDAQRWESALSSTNRTQHDVAGGRYFPEVEGAVADGSTNDSAAIAEAATKAVAAGGKVDLAPLKAYGVGTMLTFAAGAIIDGHGSATLRMAGAVTIGARFSGATVFRDLFVDFMQIPTSYGIQIQAAGSEFERVTFTNSNGPTINPMDGLKIEAGCKLTSCTFRNIGQPVHVTGAATGVKIKDCEFFDWTIRAIYVANSSSAAPSNVRVQDNTIHPPNALAGDSQPRQPVTFQGTATQIITNVQVTGNQITGCGTSHDPTAAQLSAGVQYGTADLISLHDVDDFVVSGNQVTESGDVGITITERCTNGVVNTNVCTRSDSCGICIGGPTDYYCRDISATGNTLMDNGQNRAADGPDWASAGMVIQNAIGIMIGDNRSGDSFPASAWAPTKAYVQRDRVYLPDNSVLQVTAAAGAGTSGSTAPAAPGVGLTVSDGTVTWTQIASKQTQKTQTYGFTIDTSRDITVGVNNTVGNKYGDYNDTNNTNVTYTPQPIIIEKQADTPINNSAVLTADSELAQTLTPGTYEVELDLDYNSDQSVSSTADLACKWTGPAGTTFAWLSDHLASSNTSANGTINRVWNNIGTTATLGGITGTDLGATMRGRLKITTTGVFAFNWAQSTATASNTIVRAGSRLKITRR